MKVNGSSLLELTAIKECFDVLRRWLLDIGEDVRTPSVGIPTSEIPSHQLLQDMRNMKSFENSNLGGVFAIRISDVLDEWRECECPLIWRNGDEQ